MVGDESEGMPVTVFAEELPGVRGSTIASSSRLASKADAIGRLTLVESKK